jgi:hypothetical protein
MTTITTAQPETVGAAEFRVGRAFARTFAILKRHLLPFFALTAIATLPNLLGDLSGALRLQPGSVFGFKPLGYGIGVLSFLLTMAAQAVVLYGTFQDMRGRQFGTGETLRRGLARIMPVLGITICVGLAVGIAMAALIIPGLMLATALYVALPVCVVERLGVFASMGRSSRLTKSHRWRVFGILALTVLVDSIAKGLIHGIAEAPGWSIVGTLASFVWQTLAGAFEAILAVVVYHDLRVIKEGVDVEQIAAVFD